MESITYDYGVIDECIALMKNKASEIQNQSDELYSDVKRIMQDWEGSTANAYDAKAQQLNGYLVDSRTNLDNLKTALHTSATDMQARDSRGAAAIG
ncbi:WXG100 family type VII secretion target [Lentzea sp. NBRC 102530]|uniref:WXG100 family type VII secretion target n=1 Tax=Lentzea sp. NBRC 102530 TaxID=3032201 RepID=UPI0024A52418|nr:WXG100 family type VII secretion target [Lentzea sp. NBRC 102530]GLY46815.1 hypothetical protein Lesp01_04710 [Lentzea sp. NBRC 102530]